jgi:hypothetical protein
VVEGLVLGGFEELRDGGQARVGHEVAEAFPADRAAADMLVAVRARALRPLRVVDVDGGEVLKADCPLESQERLGVTLRRRKLVTRRVDVAGIEAHGHAPLLPNRAEYVSEVLEAMAHGGPLARGGLEQHAHARSLGQSEGFIESGGDAGHTGGFALAPVRPGMEDEVADSERLAAENLVGEGGDRLPAQLRRRRREIDQVRSVSGHVGERRAPRRAPELPRLDLLDRLADPPVVVLDEDLNDPAACGNAALDRARSPARDGLVGAEGQVGMVALRRCHDSDSSREALSSQP